jgi:predicted nucleotidyltransferase
MASPRAADFSALLASLTRALDEKGLPFMLIGGQAVLLHGRPRLTEDIDVTLGADPGRLADVRAVCETLALRPLPEDLEAFVRQTFVLPALHEESGVRIDFIFSTTPYERQAIGRAERVDVGGTAVPFATAEDLIVHKLFAGRPRDWEDAVGVARRKGGTLDWAYVERWAAEFGSVPGRERLPEDVRRLRRETESRSS